MSVVPRFGQNTTEMLKYFFRDMARVTGPHSTLLSRKKEIRPFEDQEPIEYLSQKQDASLFMFGSHNKKRPHNVVIGRTYDGHIRDMVELGLESLRPLEGFNNEGNVTGSKPCIVFNGVAFEREPVHIQLKSILIDMFRGDTVENISLEGIDHVISVTSDGKHVHIRHYRIVLKKSGSKLPLVELKEIGPRSDFSVRRHMQASEDVCKLSMKQPASLKAKKKKNTEKNILGDTLGRIHMQKQNYDRLQTRKVRALKKGPLEKVQKREDEGSVGEVDSVDAAPGRSKKRRRHQK